MAPTFAKATVGRPTFGSSGFWEKAENTKMFEIYQIYRNISNLIEILPNR